MKNYHIILILISPIGMEKTFSGSWIKFSYGLNAFDKFFSHFSIEFLSLHLFVVVSIVIRLIVMSYLLPMHGIYHCPPIERVY